MIFLALAALLLFIGWYLMRSRVKPPTRSEDRPRCVILTNSPERFQKTKDALGFGTQFRCSEADDVQKLWTRVSRSNFPVLIAEDCIAAVEGVKRLLQTDEFYFDCLILSGTAKGKKVRPGFLRVEECDRPRLYYLSPEGARKLVSGSTFAELETFKTKDCVTRLIPGPGLLERLADSKRARDDWSGKTLERQLRPFLRKDSYGVPNRIVFCQWQPRSDFGPVVAAKYFSPESELLIVTDQADVSCAAARIVKIDRPVRRERILRVLGGVFAPWNLFCCKDVRSLLDDVTYRSWQGVLVAPRAFKGRVKEDDLSEWFSPDAPL